MPQFGFYPAQIFWLVVSFGILFISMQFFLLPPVEKILKQRQEKITAILDKAERLTKQAEELTNKYQMQIDLATQKSSEAIQEVHNQIALEQSKREEELLQSLEKDIERAQNNLKNRQKSVFNHIEKISYNFIQCVCEVLYDFIFSEKELVTEIKHRSKEIKNAK